MAHQHPEEPHRQTKRVALYPAPHPALLALPLLSALMKTWVPPSLIQTPARSLQIHSERKLQKGIRGRGSGNCNHGRCLHLDQWSLAVTASIYLFPSDMTYLVFATCRLLELYMWNSHPFMGASNLETVCYATRRVSKALTEAQHRQIIEM